MSWKNREKQLGSLCLFLVLVLERIDKKSCLLLKSIVKYIHKKCEGFLAYNSYFLAEWIGM